MPLLDQPALPPSFFMSALRHPLARIATILLIGALAHFHWLPFPWRMPVVGALAVGLIWLETRSWHACGLKPRSLRATLGWILLLLVIVIGLVNPFVQPLLDQLTGTKADYSGYGALRGNIAAAAQLVGGAWLSAAVGEELVFRAFLMHQLERLVGRMRGGMLFAAALGGGMLFAAALGGVAFGLMHASQGMSGVLLTGVVGVLFGYVYLRSGRNLWAMIVAHGLIDTWGVATLYLGWY